MKKYKLFKSYVVEKDGYKFICEIEFINSVSKIYKEVFTNERITGKASLLIDYYSSDELENINLNKKRYLLTKQDILLKYIQINQEKIKKEKTKEDLYMDFMIGMWEDYVETKKDSLPDIPIISVKELRK